MQEVKLDKFAEVLLMETLLIMQEPRYDPALHNVIFTSGVCSLLHISFLIAIAVDVIPAFLHTVLHVSSLVLVVIRV